MKAATFRNMLWRRQADTLSATSFIELVLLTMLPLCGGFLFNQDDPFLLQSRFPVLLVPPLLFALRYGLTLGVTSYAVTLLSVTGAYFYSIGNISQYPGDLLVGTLILTVLAGEMTHQLRTKIRRGQAEMEMLNMRFGEFTNTYHVMKVSHDQLKEQLANAKFSLREALQMVRDKLREQHWEGNQGLNPQVGNALLSVFNYFCSTRIAGVYPVDADGAVTAQPIAVQGNMGDLGADDQLIAQMLEQGSMVSILPEMHVRNNNEELATNLLAAIPLKDASGRLRGIVAIAEMDFHAFQAENLNLMRLIGSYTGDILSRSENIFYAASGRKTFVNELKNFWRLAKEFDIPSSIICITLHKTAPNDDYPRAIVNRIRGLDHAWIHSGEKKCLVTCLMPLMTASEYPGFRKSLNVFLQDHFGQTVEDAKGMFHHLEIRGEKRFSDYIKFIGDQMNTEAARPSATAQPARKREAIMPNTKASTKYLPGHYGEHIARAHTTGGK